MKKLLTTLGLVALSATAAKATVTLNGIAFLNAPQISVGDVGFFIVDINNTGFSSISFTEGEILSSAASYGDYVVLGSKSATALSTNVTLSGAFSGIALANGVTAGDRFAAVVFNSSTTSAIGGDSFTIWTDPTWVIPADGSTLSYQASPTGANFKQLGASSLPTITGTVSGGVIPEPSAFAALAGLAGLGFAGLRRRRRA